MKRNAFKRGLQSSSQVKQTTITGIKRKDLQGGPKGYNNKIAPYKLQSVTLSGLPDTSKSFTVLGIDTSCDDTGVGIVRSDGTILSNFVASQYAVHENFGGIVPTLAKEAHMKHIEDGVVEALSKAGLKSVAEVDAIAVTQGPGLEMCLDIGICKAKTLAKEHNKPFVVVNHLEAHCITARYAGELIEDHTIDSNPIKKNLDYPYLAVLASGGHTSIMICKSFGEFDVLGGTRDDALGEAFDKAARMLGLNKLLPEHFTGAAVEHLAQKGNPKKYPMSVPMEAIWDCDFSFAGLKTNVRNVIKSCRDEHGLSNSLNSPLNTMESVEEFVTLPLNTTADICASFQVAAVAHVLKKLTVALEYVNLYNISLSGIAVVGGVARNKYLRSELLKLLNARARANIDKNRLPLVFPPPNLCTDNGVMVAWTGLEKLKRGISDSTDLDPIPRWPLGKLVDKSKFIRPKKFRNKMGKRFDNNKI